MRTRNVLIAAGIILILFNLLPYLSSKYREAASPEQKTIAFQIGFHFMAILGLLLLVIASIVHRRVKKRRRKEMVDGLFE